MNHIFRAYGGAVIHLIPLFFYPVLAVAVPSLLVLVFACSLHLATVALERRKSPRAAIACSDSTSFFFIAGADLAFVTTALRQDVHPSQTASLNLHHRSNCFFSTCFEDI